MKIKKIDYECGCMDTICYDSRYTQIDVLFGMDKIKTPLITIVGEKITGKKGKERIKSTNLLTLHIKEAIELKSVIDRLVVDYLEGLNEAKDDNNE